MKRRAKTRTTRMTGGRMTKPGDLSKEDQD